MTICRCRRATKPLVDETGRAYADALQIDRGAGMMARATGRMRGLGFGFSIGVLELVLWGPAPAMAANAAGDVQVDSIVTYTSKPGNAEKAAIKTLGGKVKHDYTLIKGMAITLPAKNVDKLRHSPKVKSVEHDATITALEP